MTPRDLIRLKRELGVKYADLVYNGLWFTPMRQAIDAFPAIGEALRVAAEHLEVGHQVMAKGHGLRRLQVRVRRARDVAGAARL